MGAPALLVSPDSSHQPSSLPSSVGSPFSPSESASSSLSFTDSASSSFTQSLPPMKQEKHHHHHRKKKDLLEVQKKTAKLKQVKKSTSTEPLRESNTALASCTTKGSKRKACSRCAGAFAADCAALCCCPCGILSYLAFFLVELPSTVARKLASHLQARLCIKDATSAPSSRGGDNSHSIFTPTWSSREPSAGEGEKQAVSVIRFDTQNLLKHFEAEHVGFGCLSQKRE